MITVLAVILSALFITSLVIIKLLRCLIDLYMSKNKELTDENWNLKGRLNLLEYKNWKRFKDEK